MPEGGRWSRLPLTTRGLIVACLLMLPIFTARVAGVMFAAADPSFFGIGTDLSAVQTIDESGVVSPLPAGKATLLLVFRSDCAWCEKIAPEWAKWFEQHPDASVLALTPEPIADGVAYAGARGWAVEIRQVAHADHVGTVEAALTSRTPWAFVLGLDGRIEAATYPNSLDSLHALVLEGVRTAAASPLGATK